MIFRVLRDSPYSVTLYSCWTQTASIDRKMTEVFRRFQAMPTLGPQAVFGRFEHLALALNLRCTTHTHRNLRRFAV